MFNSGIRGRRAKDGEGTVSSQASFIQSTDPVPTITGYTISGVDDLAANTSGGQTIIVNGSGFAAGMSATLGGVLISPITIISSTQLSFTAPVKSAGSYPLTVYAAAGSAAVLVPGITFSGVPQFANTSGTSVGTYYETKPISSDVKATSDSSISYSIVSGSLPAGATLNSNGTITGTSPATTGADTYTFQVKATDAELQDTTVTYTLTVNTDAVQWTKPASNNATITISSAGAYSNSFVANSAAGYSVSFTANTLPAGLSLASNGAITGTPSVSGNTTTLITATTATTGRTATRTVNWTVSLSLIANFSGVTSFSIGTSTSAAQGGTYYCRHLNYSPDGLKVYFWDINYDRGYVTDVSPAWSLPSSMQYTYSQGVFQDGQTNDATFCNNGTMILRLTGGNSNTTFKLFTVYPGYTYFWTSPTLYQTSATFTTNRGSGYNWGGRIAEDGKHLSFIDQTSGTIYIYKMTTAYDLSTISYLTSVTLYNYTSYGGGLLPNGTGIWSGHTDGNVAFAPLTTAYDFNTKGTTRYVAGGGSSVWYLGTTGQYLYSFQPGVSTQTNMYRYPVTMAGLA